MVAGRTRSRPPPGRAGTPRTPKPSWRGLDRARPRARSALVTVSIRSVSFARSSCAPADRLSPRAIAASQGEERQLVDRVAAPPPARPPSRPGRRARTSMSATGSPPACRRLKREIRAPIRSSTWSRPVRRRVDADAVDPEPRARAAASRRRGRAPPTRSRRAPRATAARAARPARPRRVPAARRTRAPAAASMPLGVVARRYAARRPRSGRPSAYRPGEQDARLDLRARDRQLVADRPCSAPPAIVTGARPVCRLDARAHLGQRRGDPLHRARGAATRRRQLEPPVLAGEESRAEQSEQGAGSCRSRSARPARAARAGRRRDANGVGVILVTSTPSAAAAAIVDSVSAERPKPVIARLALARRADQERAVGDRLVARHGEAARPTAMAGSILISEDRRDETP